MKTLSLKHTANLIDVTESTVTRWVRQGTFPQPFRFGKKYRFREDEVLAFTRGEWSAPVHNTDVHGDR